MEALYSKTGKVYAWLDISNGNILNLRGEHIAFVHGNSVFDWNGRHKGWWIDGCIRDATNAAAYFTSDAGSIGVVKPVKAVKPAQPVKKVAPVRPVKHVKPVRPVKRLAWSSLPPF
jgi:hypothetical protein